MTSYAFLFCLGLAESTPAERGRQHAAPSSPTPPHFVSPDFVLQLRVSDNATATLFAYKRAPHQGAAVGPPLEEHRTPVGEDGAEWDDDDEGRDLSFVPFDNDKTYQLQQLKHFSVQPSAAGEEYYDGKGAMYFAIAVILFYGISIAMLVAASTLRRSHTDYELKGFLRSYARIDEERRSREKQKVRMVLQQKNLLHMLPGCNAACNAALMARTANPSLQQQLLFKRQLLRRREETALPNLEEEQQSLSSASGEQPPVQQREQQQREQQREQQQQQTERCEKEEREKDSVASQQQRQRRCLRVFYRVTDGSTKTEPEIDAGVV